MVLGICLFRSKRDSIFGSEDTVVWHCKALVRFIFVYIIGGRHILLVTMYVVQLYQLSDAGLGELGLTSRCHHCFVTSNKTRPRSFIGFPRSSLPVRIPTHCYAPRPRVLRSSGPCQYWLGRLSINYRPRKSKHASSLEPIGIDKAF